MKVAICRKLTDISIEVLCIIAVQWAAQLTVLKVCPCGEWKPKFKTETLNAKHHGLGYSALKYLHGPENPAWSEKHTISKLIIITKSINEFTLNSKEDNESLG